MTARNLIIKSALWIAHTLTIFIIGIYLYKSLQAKARTYTVNITLLFNFFCILYPFCELFLCWIPEDDPWNLIISMVQNVVFHLAVNWATALALFTYGVLNASGPFPFRSFMIWSIFVSIALSLFSSFVVDVKWSEKAWADYFHFSVDGIMSGASIAIIYINYSKAYDLIVSGKLGKSIYTDTSASKILWYSRITLICHAPNVISDVLVIIQMVTGGGPSKILELYWEYNPTRVLFSSWALLNLWVDWSVMRVYRERAVTKISYRTSKCMSGYTEMDAMELCFDGDDQL